MKTTSDSGLWKYRSKRFGTVLSRGTFGFCSTQENTDICQLIFEYFGRLKLVRRHNLAGLDEGRHGRPLGLALVVGWPQNLEYPLRFRPFKNLKELNLINATCAMLETSGFYWGPMVVGEAHARLKGEPLGTFLVRDSQQKDFFFTLSYCSRSGPVSIRINFQDYRFNLSGNKETFDSLFKLLEHYTSSPRSSLTRPYRKVRLRSLQELCRQRIVETWGRERLHSLPVNHVVKDFLLSFPFRL